MAKPQYPLTPRGTYYLRDLRDSDRFQFIGDRKRRVFEVVKRYEIASEVVGDDGEIEMKEHGLPVKYLRSNEKS